MASYDSDALDQACEEIKGHTNWAYFDTLTPAEQKKLIDEGATIVVFYDEPSEEDDEE